MIEEFESLSVDSGMSSLPSALIDGLPRNISERELKSLLLFSKDLVSVDIISASSASDNIRDRASALARFKSNAGAEEAASSLHGKELGGGEKMTVRLLQGPSIGSGFTSRRDTLDGTNRSPPSTLSSNGLNPRQTSRFNGTFATIEKNSSPPGLSSTSSSQDLPSLADSGYLQNIFSPQSPPRINNSSVPRVSGKSVVLDTSVDDDEAGEILKDLGGYGKSNSSSTSNKNRRTPNPNVPVSRFGLSLATNNINAMNMNGLSSPNSGIMNTPPPASAPAHMQNVPPNPNMHMFNNHHNYPRVLPPVNPADQNPPCNTLYVGNLPMNTSEDELKALFSRQRGYKRLCFRTKQNGPMCFVEFEDVAYATRALTELYGRGLSNSVKGGIRLSFSKNPLGVRSGQQQSGGSNGTGLATPTTPHSAISGGMGVGPGMSNVNGQSFSTALHAPPGLNPPSLSSSSSVMSAGGHSIPPLASPPLNGMMTPGPMSASYTSLGSANGMNPMNGGYGGNGMPPPPSLSASGRSPQPESMPHNSYFSNVNGPSKLEYRSLNQNGFPDFMLGR
jgi:hypothetical protein